VTYPRKSDEYNNFLEVFKWERSAGSLRKSLNYKQSV
jgi:hypothetical protein